MTTKRRAYRLKWNLDTETMVASCNAYDANEQLIVNTNVRCDATKLSEYCRKRATLHGINQTIADTAALGAGATLAKKLEFMRERAAHLETGSDSWTSTTREPGEGTILFQALMRESPKRDAVKVREYVVSLTASKRSAMMNSERLRDHVAEIRAELGKEVDAEELFDELDSVE